METPHVNPIGLVETPPDFEASPRRFSRPLRVLAGALLVLFLLAAVVSGSVSLGRYCLTTDAADTRALRPL